MKKSILISTIVWGLTFTTNAQSIPVKGNGFHYYGPNSTWGEYLKVGGNGRETTKASVVSTNGNLHLDSKDGRNTYINHYSKTNTFLNTQGGNVGIGTSNPAERLHINGNIRGNAPGGALKVKTEHGYIDVGAQNTSWAHIYTDRPKIIFNKDVYSTTNAFSSYNNDLIFKTKGAERLRIDDINGSVGIGTNDPKSKLHVNGDFYMNIGEGFKLFGDINYFGEYRDGIIFEMQDVNATNGNTDGGFVFRGYSSTDSIKKDWMVIRSGGLVGIGTNNPDAKLTVKGRVHAEEVKIDLSVPAPDYVFLHDYDLKSIDEVEAYIKKEGHLPNIPSAKIMETEGVDLGVMNMKLLEKIEELTLYTIEQEKQLKKQKASISKMILTKNKLESKNKDLEARLVRLETLLLKK
ncbi:hypothetical protein [Tenacibaculum agarivorans]|uniref:hypothetical protein n=1 Tax=Tenacibaculum agarivorans TaxID=1908389 RepID=UPI00094B7CFD|nr:hypothetical protein [Tenacibaculum agarivorans]